MAEYDKSIEWLNSLEADDFENFKLDFAVAIERALNTSGKKRVDLAKEIEVSPARITKILRGDANLTMEVMYKMAKALNHKIHVHLAPEDASVRWFNVMTTSNQPIRQAYAPQYRVQKVINANVNYQEAA